MATGTGDGRAMLQETGKQRSQRIEMDYYRQRGGLAKSKVALGGLALLLGAAAVGYATLTGGGSIANPGDVIAGHASFEDDCSKCHKFMTPIAGDSLREVSLLGISETKTINHIESSCKACHQSAGDHYRAMMTSEGQLMDKDCVNCHADHQGRDFDLASVTSDKCIQCHGQLSTFCTGPSELNSNITGFTASTHGNFKTLEQDPGQVKFDHAQHMTLGQPSTIGGKDVIRLKDLRPDVRESYRQKMIELKAIDPNLSELDTSDEGLVQLDCSSCHEITGTVNPGGLTDFGPDMTPISFEQHCSACHEMNLAGRSEQRRPVPHAVSWSEMEPWLKANVTGTIGADTSSNPTRIGVATGTSSAEPMTPEMLTAKIELQRAALKQQCTKCHDAALVEDDAAIVAALKSPEPLIPDRFFQHGVYDHAAHLRVDCKYCHQLAYDGNPEDPPEDHTKVMIAGIESCVGCHRPTGTPDPPDVLDGTEPKAIFGGHSVWASDKCIMCHGYHSTPSFLTANTGAKE